MYNRHIQGSLGLKATFQTFLLHWNLLDWTPPLNGHLLTLNNLWRTLNVGIQKMIFGVSLFDWIPTYIEQYGRYTGVFNVSMVHCICAPEFGCGHAIPTPQTDDSNHWMGLLRNRHVLYIYIYQQLGITMNSCFIIEADRMRKLQDYVKVHGFFSHLETMSASCRGFGWWRSSCLNPGIVFISCALCPISSRHMASLMRWSF
jgi:hypothetical protein